MSDAIGTTNLRRSADSLEKQPVFDGYSKVILIVSDEVEYVAGDDTGRTFTTSSPWGTKEMANRILAKIRGFQYQAYTASKSYLDPSVEIGDGVTIGKVYSGIFSKDVSHGPLYTADIAAPGEKKIDYKYPYKSTQERKVSREMKNLTAELRVQADRIAAEVADRKEQGDEFRALFEVQSREIAAKVSSQVGSSSSDFWWKLLSTGWDAGTGSKTVFSVKKNGAYVDGEIRASSGKIGGFDIMSNYLSFNGHTWGGTNTTGIYCGPQGIQLGSYDNGFRVTNTGDLYANTGHFRGSVDAGSIQYGGSAGYFSGSGLSTGSVYGGSGGKISGGSLSTFNMNGGINSSLANGDYAYSAVRGWIIVPAFHAGSLDTNDLTIGGRQIDRATIRYTNSSGGISSAQVLVWS